LIEPLEKCFAAVLCFVPPSTDPYWKLFGFSEFLTALALLVVVYTTADVRYRFRIAIAPGNLHQITFILAGVIGFGILFTDVWAAQGWWVPRAEVMSRALWQAIFGSLFLGTFLTWMFYAFIRPSIFGSGNAERYAQVLYGYVLRGSNDELRIIADELGRSVHALVKASRTLPKRFRAVDDTTPEKVPTGTSADYAHDVLLLIADRRLCRHIVESAPLTVQLLFVAMSKERKFDIPVAQFTRNISSEAIGQKTSFVYTEAEGVDSGLMGYIKPVTAALYGDHELSEGLANQNASPLDIPYSERKRWDAQQWEAYCRVVLMTIRDYLEQDRSRQHSYALVRALSHMKEALSDVYALNDLELVHNEAAYLKLTVVLKFVEDAIAIVDEQQRPPVPYSNQTAAKYPKDFYDYLATTLYEACLSASRVKSSKFSTWHVQHNLVWNTCFGWETSKAWTIVRHKLRRLLFDEIVSMENRLNYQSAPLLGFCLNVMGLTSPKRSDRHREWAALAFAVHSWASRHYGEVWRNYRDVAEEVLVGGLSFDERGSQFVKTYSRGLSNDAPKEYLAVAGEREEVPRGPVRRLKKRYLQSGVRTPGST
jgi:hypothetical protein